MPLSHLPFARRWVTYGAIALSVGGAVAIGLPHTLFLDKYRDHYQMFRKGLPVMVPKELFDQTDETLKTLKLAKRKETGINFFIVNGVDPIHAGSTQAVTGAIIGLPVNMTYKRLVDVDRDSYRLNGNKIDWTSPEAKEFLSTLIYSDRVKRFLIAREVRAVSSHEVFVRCALGPIAVMSYMYITQFYNDKYKLLEKPFFYRSVMYLIAALFSATLTVFLLDFLTNFGETSADEETAQLGREYIEAGIEFYETTLRRNKILRAMLGTEGRMVYDEDGNEIYLLGRNVHRQVTERLKSLQDLLEVSKQTEQSEKKKVSVVIKA